MVKFSLIIPVYNVQGYLCACLDSVLVQTCIDWEARCVDDGSLDCSGAILDEYARRDERFKIIHQPNAGSSAARNRGLDGASGEWVWFVDADDTIVPEALVTFQRLGPQADVTYFGVNVEYQDGFVEGKHPARVWAETDSQIDRLIAQLANGHLGDIFGWTVDKVIRRALIERYHLRFDTTISFYEDEVFALGLMKHLRTLASIPTALYNYRPLDSGLTAKGIPNPYVLVRAFMRARGEETRRGVNELVNIRVTKLLRECIVTRHSIRAARMMIEVKSSSKGKLPSMAFMSECWHAFASCQIGWRQLYFLSFNTSRSSESRRGNNGGMLTLIIPAICDLRGCCV